MTLALQPRQRNLFGANFLRCSRRPFSCLKRPDRPDRDPVPLAEHDRLTEKRLEQAKATIALRDPAMADA
jgi:hypothetical protein